MRKGRYLEDKGKSERGKDREMGEACEMEENAQTRKA